MNHLTRYMLDQYGLRGTILLQGGLVLQGVVFGLLLLPPKRNLEELSDCVNSVEVENKHMHNRSNGYIRAKNRNCCSCFFSSKENNNQTDIELRSINASSHEHAQITQIHNIDSLNNNKNKNCYSVKTFLNLVFNRKLLTSVMLWSFLFCNFTVQLAYTIPFNLLPDQSVEKGIDKHHVSWIMSSIGK